MRAGIPPTQTVGVDAVVKRARQRFQYRYIVPPTCTYRDTRPPKWAAARWMGWPEALRHHYSTARASVSVRYLLSNPYMAMNLPDDHTHLHMPTVVHTPLASLHAAMTERQARALAKGYNSLNAMMICPPPTRHRRGGVLAACNKAGRASSSIPPKLAEQGTSGAGRGGGQKQG